MNLLKPLKSIDMGISTVQKALDKSKEQIAVEKETDKSVAKIPKSGRNEKMVRISRFHRELAKICARREGGIKIDEFINICVDSYCREKYPELYQIAKELMRRS
jgi:hypothetical protein